MKSQVIAILKKDLSQAEDNLSSATRQFSRLSASELDCEYGQSGDTCREVRDGYLEQVNSLKRCITWVGTRTP